MFKMTDEMKEYVATTHCFTAAEGMHGHHKGQSPNRHVDPRLHNTVFAVVVLRNGESFVGYTICRKDSNHSFQTASEIAKDKAFRKVKEHLAKNLVSTLL